MAYNLNIVTFGEGTVSFERDPLYENIVTITATPAQYHYFDKFVFIDLWVDNDSANITDLENNQLSFLLDDSSEITTNPYTVTLTSDTELHAYFGEYPKYHITVETNIDYGSVYISQNDFYSGYSSTLWVRPYPGYHFSKWSDGNTENPRSITVTSDIYLCAEYARDLVTTSIYQYRCYIKDQLNLTDLPKAFLRVSTFDIKTDLMTNSNSTMEVYDLDQENVRNGDILVLYDPRGNILYNGVIKSIEPMYPKLVDAQTKKYRVTCSQMQSFYKGQWIYEKGETPPTSFDNSWKWEKFTKLEGTYPIITDFDGLTASDTQTFVNTYSNSKWSTWNINQGDNYSARCTTYVWCDRPIILNITFATDNNGSVALNDVTLTEIDSGSANAKTVECSFVKGMNKLQVCYTEDTGGDGWKMYLNYLAFSPYSPTKTYAVDDRVQHDEKLYRCSTAITTPEAWTSGHWTQVTGEDTNITSMPHILGINSTPADSLKLEKALENILKDYSQGKIVGSDYVDPHVARRLGGITPECVESTSASLTTMGLGSTVDFEDFIYSMYDKHGIIFDFEINVSGPNYVTIKVPEIPEDEADYLTVGNNTYAIKSMNPITTIEETNRMIVFASDNVTYRTTFVATENDIIEAPESLSNRFDITNTVIVFSDDPIDDLKADNLPNQMYNHQISFVLRMDNFVYDFNNFNLGTVINIYHNDDFYKSVYTGFEISKKENKNISEVNMICGKVRQKLTKKLSLGKV